MAVSPVLGAALVLTVLNGAGAIIVEVCTETALQTELPGTSSRVPTALRSPASITGIVVGSLVAAPAAQLLGLTGTFSVVCALGRRLHAVALHIGRHPRHRGWRSRPSLSLPRRPDGSAAGRDCASAGRLAGLRMLSRTPTTPSTAAHGRDRRRRRGPGRDGHRQEGAEGGDGHRCTEQQQPAPPDHRARVRAKRDRDPAQAPDPRRRWRARRSGRPRRTLPGGHLRLRAGGRVPADDLPGPVRRNEDEPLCAVENSPNDDARRCAGRPPAGARCGRGGEAVQRAVQVGLRSWTTARLFSAEWCSGCRESTCLKARPLGGSRGRPGGARPGPIAECASGSFGASCTAWPAACLASRRSPPAALSVAANRACPCQHVRSEAGPPRPRRVPPRHGGRATRARGWPAGAARSLAGARVLRRDRPPRAPRRPGPAAGWRGRAGTRRRCCRPTRRRRPAADADR